MPTYDFECPHGHVFEKNVSMDQRNEPVPCEGMVNQLITDEQLAKVEAAIAEFKEKPESILVQDVGEVQFVPLGDTPESLAVTPVPCRLKATKIMSHANPGGMLDHGMAANRDAAREGRYDPLNPSRRFMSSGRSWRR